MAAASDAAASTALGAPSSPNLSKRLFKGSLYDANCCKNCSLFTRMRHLAENGNSLKLSSSAFCAASRARTAFLVASAAASLADAPLQFRASSAASRVAIRFSLLRRLCLSCLFGQSVFFSLSDCFCLIGDKGHCHLFATSHTWLLLLMLQPQQHLVRRHFFNLSKRFFRAASVMLTVAGTAASLLKKRHSCRERQCV